MMVSTKGRYGLKAMVDLAMCAKSEAVTLKSISDRQNISEGYLEQIFSALRKSGLVTGRKGSQGGYSLSKPLNEITVGEILNALEGDVNMVDIIRGFPYDTLDECINKNVWSVINENIHSFFDSVTLESLVENYKVDKETIMYYI